MTNKDSSKRVGAGRPGLATTNQVRAWRERLHNERLVAAALVEEKIARMGGKIYEPSNYFLYYKPSDSNSRTYHEVPLTFTIDKLSASEPFDPKAKRDRWAAVHRLRQEGFKTSHNILSSQVIGDRPAIEDSRSYGNGRKNALRGTLFYPNHLHV